MLDSKQVSPPGQRGSKGIEENEDRDSCDGGEEDRGHVLVLCLHHMYSQCVLTAVSPLVHSW